MLSLESILGFCHGIVKGGDCKVEFNQPSCWLYSMPNLLVFKQLVTLHLSGNHVRIVCERVWRIAQDCAKKQRLAAGSHGWLTAASRQNDAHVPSMPEAEESHQLLHYRTKVPGWPSHLLAAWTCDSTQSQGQVAITPCLGKIDLTHSFLPYIIYTLIPTI